MLTNNDTKYEDVGSEPTTRVWVNGTFDVLHLGHIHLFQHAKNLFPNTILCVGVDDDARVQSMKGVGRPIHPLEYRVEFLKSIKFIDRVVTFGSDDELRANIRDFNAEIMCIGDDYRGRTIIGEELVKRVVYVERFGGLSSTKIVNNR